MKTVRTLLSLVALLHAQVLWAARPFVTDDARLTTAGSCQVESWTRQYQNSHEYWVLPACNPTGNLEFTAGGARAGNDGQPQTSDYLYQVKTLVRELRPSDWGWGLGIGRVNHPGSIAGPNLFGNTYLYLPASFSFKDDDIVMHVNVGILKDRLTRDKRTTLGIGGEFRLNPRLLGIAEVYGDDANKPYYQVGARYHIIQDRFQFDTTVGGQTSEGRNTRWLSFGLRFTPDRFL